MLTMIYIDREKVGEIFQILGDGERQATHYARKAFGLPQHCPQFAGTSGACASIFMAELFHLMK